MENSQSDLGNRQPCIDEETMACYIDGLLSEEEIKQVEKHIATCDRCKEIIEITRKIKKN